MCEVGGVQLDDWQSYVLSESLGEQADGLWSSFELAVIASRQNGKSELLVGRLLVGLFLLGEKELIYCSYQFDSALIVFRRLVSVIEDTPAFSKRVARINRSHGVESIELKDGARVSFRTRTKLGGRGHSCDCLIFDEAHILSTAAHGSLLPMVSARRRAQIWFAATAPDIDVNEDAIVLAGIRERAIKGENVERLGYHEWSIDAGNPEDVTLEMARDPERWAEANPALGTRISLEQIAREQEAMDPRSFAVERLGAGAWPRGDGLPGVLDPECWKACDDSTSTVLDPVVFSFDVSPTTRDTAISVAGLRTDGLMHIEVVEVRKGTSGVAERVAELTKSHTTTAVIADEKGPAGSLLPSFAAAGVKVRLVDSTELASACGMFFDAVMQGRLRYRRKQALDIAVENATKRALGDGGWAWSRKSSSVNIAPLVSVTLAAWGAWTLEPSHAEIIDMNALLQQMRAEGKGPGSPDWERESYGDVERELREEALADRL
jgi:phage terminase large subunit-like protein